MIFTCCTYHWVELWFFLNVGLHGAQKSRGVNLLTPLAFATPGGDEGLSPSSPNTGHSIHNQDASIHPLIDCLQLLFHQVSPLKWWFMFQLFQYVAIFPLQSAWYVIVYSRRLIQFYCPYLFLFPLESFSHVICNYSQFNHYFLIYLQKYFVYFRWNCKQTESNEC